MTALLAKAVVLAGIYLLTLASLDPVDLATGLVVGAAVALALRRFTGAVEPVPARTLPRRTLAALRLALVTLRDITVGTWDVALVVLHLRPLRAPGIVAVPVGSRTPAGVALTAWLTTLAPGEFLVDVDWERGVLLVHVLDASDPDAVRARYEEAYRRHQVAVIP